jgi:hypothetical protein
VKGKNIDLHLLIDIDGRGGKLFQDMFTIAHEQGATIATGFVNSKNLLAKKLYLIIGARFDGLKDYTWIKE